MNFNTSLLHKNFNGEKYSGSTNIPIYQVNAFKYESSEELEKVFNNKAPGFAYTRVSNPTSESFEKRIAAIEGGISATSCSSGMAAVAMSLLNILGFGDEVISSSCLFGGTLDLLQDFKNFGIKTNLIEDVTAENVEKLITDKTKAVFTELIGNPKLNVVDIKKVSEVCHKYDIPLIVDATTATPYIIKPIEYGADIVVHSTSKYINGSGNSISGIIIDSGKFNFASGKFIGFEKFKKFGKFAYTAKLKNDIWRNMGVCVSPFNAYLNAVGLETLGVRMERLCCNALELAKYLETFDGISVNYPGLESNKYYGLFKSELNSKGGAIVTIRTGSREKAFKLINNLKYASIATNIGDVRTLVIHPESTIYTHNSESERELAGVFDDTIRISVGLEDIEDLKEDFKQAIEKI